MARLTFLLQVYPALRNNNRNISVDKAVAFIVGQGNGNICVFDADVQRDTKYSRVMHRYRKYQRWRSKVIGVCGSKALFRADDWEIKDRG